MSNEFNINALAKQRAQEFGIIQKRGESDDAFRSRVAGKLREQGHIIEAHEAASGRLYDDPEQGSAGPMAEITGAIAQALQSWNYSPSDSERQVGDDIAAGIVAINRGSSANALATLFQALGPEADIDLLNATRGKKGSSKKT